MHLEDLLTFSLSQLKTIFHSFTGLTYEQIVAVIITSMLQRKIMNFKTKPQDKNSYLVPVLLNVLGNTNDRKCNRKFGFVICCLWHDSFCFVCALISPKAVLNYFNYLTLWCAIIQYCLLKAIAERLLKSGKSSALTTLWNASEIKEPFALLQFLQSFWKSLLT